MPPRVARSSLSAATPRTASKKHRKRQLDAYAIAGKVAPEKTKIRSHRLGVAEDDEPRNKRRRADESDEGEEQETDEEHARAQDRNKRRKQNDDDEVEFGSDSEGNEWVAGGMMDDDDDESINSDEAFGESDEERFEGFTFRGSSENKRQRSSSSKQRQTKPKSSLTDIDLDEDQSPDDDDDLGDEGVDLATMLDENLGEDGGASSASSDEDSEHSSDEDDESLDSATGDEEDIDDDDNDSVKHARLQDFVDGLDKGLDTRTADTDAANDELITLDDLLEGADLDSKTLATLKPKKKAVQMVAPLLPKRQQDAINREVATKKAKEQLDRWRDTVIQNRRAEFLSFPLKHSDESGPVAKDTFAPAQHDKPTTELEANIQKIMEESGMVARPDGHGNMDSGEADLLKAEELAIKKLPVEEVLRRRAELRRTRELLFREEIKAKRIAKIKSRSYRRVHRKERERLADKERMLMDPEGYANGVLDEDEQDLADRRRAEARMNAKHKTSKWAKSLRATDRTTWDDEARDSAIDMARRQEELKRRIAGKEIAGDESLSDVDEEGGNTQDQLNNLRKDENQSVNGLAGMKFMRAAENRRRLRNNEAIAELETDLGLGNDDQTNEIEDEGLGRAIFGPRPTSKPAQSQKQQRPELEEGDVSDGQQDDAEPGTDLGVSDETRPRIEKMPASKTNSKAKSKLNTKGRGPLAAATELLQKPDLHLREPQKPEEVSLWLSAPREKKSKLDRKLARQDDEALISTDLTSRKKAPKDDTARPVSDTKAPNTSGWTQIAHKDALEHESGSEHEKETPMLTQAERNASFHARAFAGDDVALQFDAEKEALAASEDEKEVNNNMPGWGSWAGNGLSKSVRKAAARARHNPLYKSKLPGTRPQDRKDAKLANVIISEKDDRKGRKYLAPMLPHQYEKKEEYERSLRMPIGPEWSTKEVYQRNTRPRVVVRPGAIIEPISRPLV